MKKYIGFLLIFLIFTKTAFANDISSENVEMIFAYIPNAVTTGAPLDEARLFKMGCIARTKDRKELALFRHGIDLLMVDDESPVPTKNFRQAVVFEKNGIRTEEYYFKMQQDGDDFFLVKKIVNGKSNSGRIRVASWSEWLRSSSVENYQVTSNSNGELCYKFNNIFFN